MTIRTKSLIKKMITWESTSKALKQSFSFIWTVIEPVTHCGIGNFLRLYAIPRKVFCVPATTAGVERLVSIAGFLHDCKRLRLSDANFEKQILAHCNLDIPAKQMKKPKSCANSNHSSTIVGGFDNLESCSCS